MILPSALIDASPLWLQTTDLLLGSLDRIQHKGYALIGTPEDCLGMITTADIVRTLARDPSSLLTIPLSRVMTHPVMTLQDSDVENVDQVLAFMHQHHLTYLPIIDTPTQHCRGVVHLNGLLAAVGSGALAVTPVLAGDPHPLIPPPYKLWNAFFDHPLMGIVLLNLDGSPLQYNDRFCQWIGYTRDELVDLVFLDYTHPDDITLDLTFNDRLVRGEIDDFSLEKRFIHKDGHILHGLINVYLIRDNNHNPWCTLASVVDITERNKTEIMNDAIINAIPDLMIKMNSHGRYIKSTLGKDVVVYKPELLDQQEVDIFEALPQHLAKQRMDYVRLALETQSVQIYNYQIDINDRIYEEEARVSPCSENEVLILVRNITEQKEAEVRLKRQYEHAHVIESMTRTIRQSLHLDSILQTAVFEVRKLLQTNRVIIYQFEPDLVGTITAESVSDPVFSLLGRTIEDSCFINHWHQSYLGGRTSSIVDIEDSPIQPCHRDLLRSLKVRANLVVPILQYDRLWGLLVAHHCTGPYDWDPWMVSLLSDLANQLSIAIQQSELHRQLQLVNSALQYQVNIRNAELQNLVDYEQLLRSITDRVRSSLSEAEVLEATVSSVLYGLDLTYCAISFLNPDKDNYTIHYAIGKDCPSYQGSVLPLGDEIKELLFQGRTVYYSTDHPLLGLVTLIKTPIQDEHELLGFLKLTRECIDEFTNAEIRLAEQVANQCAISIRQARLYQASQQQVQELEEVNHLKDEFVHMVSHELRTPLTNMNLALKMIETTEVSERQKRYIQILKMEWAREHNLVNELLELQALESGTRALVLTEITLPVWLPEQIDPFYLRCQQRHQSFDVEIATNLPVFLTDSALFERILMELLNNACKYTPPYEHIHLCLRYSLDQSGLDLIIDNTGVEIPSTAIPDLFEKFYRVPALDRWNQGGTGLGLALVKKSVQLLKGSITVQSQAQLTRFLVHFPVLS